MSSKFSLSLSLSLSTLQLQPPPHTLLGVASEPLSPGAEEEEEDELEETENGTPGKGHGLRGTLLTRRGITLRVLLKDKVIQAGEGLLSIHYLGKKFVGDLLPDGKIRWQETSQVFNSPSAWATHCKKLVNPAKKSGCGWASVKYQGQKLDQYKTMWLKKQRPQLQSPEMVRTPVECSAHHAPKLESKDRCPVRYSSLGSRDSGRDPHTLVELMSFTSVNRFQPFNVAVSSNVLLLDFHCHLTRSEVVGYLGGRWDTSTQLLTILRAFPCRVRLGDKDSASAVEEEICQNLFLRGLSLVGWYHSHPFSQALPSLQDIDSQMDYQLKLQGSTNSFQPCLALICAPYYHGNAEVESKISPFWVMPPPEMLLLEYYKAAPDLVKFKDKWQEEKTYLDKVKGSLATKTPKDQMFAKVLEHIYNQLDNYS
uniref:MPN domain-containing protein n=1 Tax=Callorhinchus milii TaxID=7868 RepID=A0A4W3GCR8_CALMI